MNKNDRWIQEYNNERPHQSLGDLTPKEYGQNKKFSTLSCTKKWWLDKCEKTIDRRLVASKGPLSFLTNQIKSE